MRVTTVYDYYSMIVSQRARKSNCDHVDAADEVSISLSDGDQAGAREPCGPHHHASAIRASANGA